MYLKIGVVSRKLSSHVIHASVPKSTKSCIRERSEQIFKIMVNWYLEKIIRSRTWDKIGGNNDTEKEPKKIPTWGSLPRSPSL